MTTTAKLFQLGNSQAVRIPARYRMKAHEVEIFERNGELVLRPKTETAADLFARARLAAGDAWDSMERPDQGVNRRPTPSFGK